MFKSKKIISSFIIVFVLCSFLSFNVFAEGEEVNVNILNNYDSSLSEGVYSITGNASRSVVTASERGANVVVSVEIVLNELGLVEGNTYSFSLTIIDNSYSNYVYSLNSLSISFVDSNSNVIFTSSSISNYGTLTFQSSVPNGASRLQINVSGSSNTSRLFTFTLSNLIYVPVETNTSNFANIYNTYFVPSTNFIFTRFDEFFSFVESEWYFLLGWYLINSAFIIITVFYAVFDWTEIISDDTLELGLRMVRKDRREQLYNERKEANRKEAEERYRIRQAERESELEKKANKREEERQISKQNREKENQALTHYIGGSGKYSNKELAEGYFKRFPNRYSVTIGGHKYFNLALLEKAKRDTDDKKS